MTHPRTIIFLGAGATADLMPGTDGISKILSKIFLLDKVNSNQTEFYEILKSIERFEERDAKLFGDLSIILGAFGKESAEKMIQEKAKFYSRQYDGDRIEIENNLRDLRELYDWDCLKAIAGNSEKGRNKIDIMSLYTIMDLLIEKNAGYKDNNNYYHPAKIVAARNLSLLLTHLILFSSAKKTLPKKRAQYQHFFELLTEMMSEEAILFSPQNDHDFTSREFVLFSYGIISFNWDPVLLGILFDVHQNFNHSQRIPYLGKDSLKLRLFNDFGIAIGSLKKERGKKEKLWYQGHESMAIRVNDGDYPSRLMRVGKYLFPHGSSAFRICPVCQKTNFVVRGLNEESVNVLNFYGPQILPEFSPDYTSTINDLLTKKEREALMPH